MGAEDTKSELAARCAALARREKDVLRALARYRKPKEIARELHLSVHTVRGYANSARKKLEAASTRDAAVIFANYEANLVTPQKRGDENQRVAATPSNDAVSAPGFSKSSEIDPHDAPVGGPGANLIPDVGLGSEIPTLSAGSGHPQGFEMAPPRGRHHDEIQDVVSGRGLRVHGWLARLGSVRWFVLMVFGVLGVIAAFGLAAVTLFGIFEILQQMGGSPR